jgi:hypothetical protein
MNCLHCGDCCKRMSPLGSPCPKLIQHGDIYLCEDYQNRPEQCVNHKFDTNFCPIGYDLLKQPDIETIRQRISDAQSIAAQIGGKVRISDV